MVPLFVLGFPACFGVRSLDVLPAGMLDVLAGGQVAALSGAPFGLGAGARPAAGRARPDSPTALVTTSRRVAEAVQELMPRAIEGLPMAVAATRAPGRLRARWCSAIPARR
jgi:hypothetical protein